MKKKQYHCPKCKHEITNIANWDSFLDQHNKPIFCPECKIELILHFEEFLGEAEEYVEFYFLEAN